MSWLRKLRRGKSEENGKEAGSTPVFGKSAVDVKEGRVNSVKVEGEEKVSNVVGVFSDDVNEVMEELPLEVPVESESGVGEVKGGSGKNLDFDDVLGGLGEGDSGTAAIREFVRKDENLPMKSNLKSPNALTALQVGAAYSESIGLVKRARFRRLLADYHYQHSVALNGERAAEALKALNVEINKEFEIDKHSKVAKAV